MRCTTCSRAPIAQTSSKAPRLPGDPRAQLVGDRLTEVTRAKSASSSAGSRSPAGRCPAVELTALGGAAPEEGSNSALRARALRLEGRDDRLSTPAHARCRVLDRSTERPSQCGCTASSVSTGPPRPLRTRAVGGHRRATSRAPEGRAREAAEFYLEAAAAAQTNYQTQLRHPVLLARHRQQPSCRRRAIVSAPRGAREHLSRHRPAPRASTPPRRPPADPGRRTGSDPEERGHCPTSDVALRPRRGAPGERTPRWPGRPPRIDARPRGCRLSRSRPRVPHRATCSAISGDVAGRPCRVRPGRSPRATPRSTANFMPAAGARRGPADAAASSPSLGGARRRGYRLLPRRGPIAVFRRSGARRHEGAREELLAYAMFVQGRYEDADLGSRSSRSTS